jgi:DtxR family Mn-dependent transcriptional regulator
MRAMSESEEMYLLTVARLNEAGLDGPVPITRLAEALQVMPVSVNQMVRKLEEAGLLVYTPYKGVELSSDGLHTANQVLRRRRLWESFLVEHLRMDALEADALACRMEHITPVEASERLAEYLGCPDISPRGEAIPPPEGADAPDEPPGFALSTAAPGGRLHVTALTAGPDTAAFLNAAGIAAGVGVSLLARVDNRPGESATLLVRLTDGRHMHLSTEIADHIQVRKIEL